MFTWIYYMSLFEKIAANLHHSVHPRVEPPADLGHGVPGEDAHHLRDLRHQRGRSVVGDSVHISLANAPHIQVQGVSIWAAGGSDLLGSKLWEVRLTPVLGGLLVMRRLSVLLKHAMASRCYSIHPGLHHLLQDLQILDGVDLESLGEEVGELDVGHVDDQAQNHHNGGELGHYHDGDLVFTLPVHFCILRKVF